jgi:hypothetical protein
MFILAYFFQKYLHTEFSNIKFGLKYSYRLEGKLKLIRIPIGLLSLTNEHRNIYNRQYFDDLPF